MQVTPRPDLAAALLQELLDRSDADYVSAGTAVCSIKELTFCLRAAWYGKHGHSDGALADTWDQGTRLKVSLGSAFGRLVNPTERRVELDSAAGLISGRVDRDEYDSDVVNEEGTTWRDAHYVPVEIKLTWSYKKDPPWASDQYVEQLKGYVIATGGTIGRLVVVRAGKPTIEYFEFEWTTQELEQFAAVLEGRALIVTGDALPHGPRFDWECKGCRFSHTHGGPCEN